MSAVFPKEEKLCGKTTISALISEGKWGTTEHLRYCWHTVDNETNRLLVSVPKRYFKRAVKRNLLKRRIREAYRLHKTELDACGIDFMLAYSCKEVLQYQIIETEVMQILARITKAVCK